ncbi:hypothetical protein M91_21297, partial [Bos mutus]
MDSDTLETFQNELTYSICMNYFLDPVTIDCGHSFCCPCLSLCWEEDWIPKSCPECRKISAKPHFTTNIVLKSLASLARKARADHDHSSEEQICVTHQEAKGLFCEADQTLLCGPCSECPEHGAHSHSWIQRAAEESQVGDASRAVWDLEAPKPIHASSRNASTWENLGMKSVPRPNVEDLRMHPLLQGEEKLHLEALKKEAKDICLQLKDSVFRMAQYRESLREMYGELTGMCHKLDTELLQALGNILQTTDLAEMQKPQPMNPELTCWPVSGILDMLNNFRVDNILSQTTTIHHAILDDASVMFRDNDHGASRQPRVVEGVVSWEAQAFSSGRHYWEVFVTQSSSWILGVSKDILVSDTNFSIYSEEAFVLFSKKMNDHYILFTNSLPLVQFVKKPLSRIGVFLDYDNGAVSCYDAFRSSFIYSFLPSSLSSPLKPFLC